MNSKIQYLVLENLRNKSQNCEIWEKVLLIDSYVR